MLLSSLSEILKNKIYSCFTRIRSTWIQLNPNELYYLWKIFAISLWSFTSCLPKKKIADSISYLNICWMRYNNIQFWTEPDSYKFTILFDQFNDESEIFCFREKWEVGIYFILSMNRVEMFANVKSIPAELLFINNRPFPMIGSAGGPVIGPVNVI